MFEEYLQDSHEFLLNARCSSRSQDDRTAKRYYRASAFCASGAIEAFVNYIADSFARAEALTPLEIAFLSDKVLTFDKGKQVERVEFHRIDEKLRLLLDKFVPEFDFARTCWCKFLELKQLRDSLVHPRKDEDGTGIAEYDRNVSGGLSAIIEVMNSLSSGIFNKPLRKQLLDLIPEDF
jgi:hypothetical protein